MTSKQIGSVVTDARLTPDAVRIILHVALKGEGEHEIPFDEFSQLLEEAGEKRIRKALDRAERLGYLSRAPFGGRGHHGRYSVSTPQEAVLSDSPSSEAGLNGLSTSQEAGLSAPTTTPPTTPPPPLPPEGGSRDPLGEAREYLGDATVELALASGVLPPVKLAGILGLYGPGGTQADRALSGLSPPERQSALVTAVTRFSMDAKEFNNKLFERYLNRVVNPEENDERGGTGTRTKRRGAAAKARGPAASIHGPGQRFVVE